MLKELLTNSVVLVVGYSGWLDGFMKSLRSRVLNKTDLLQAEVLWAAYETDAAAVTSGVIGEFVGAPGFTLYLGVDGHELFTVESEQDDTQSEETSAPYGYSRVPRTQVVSASYQLGAFAEGSQPVWADATPGRWPVLSSTASLERRVVECLGVGGGGGAVAIGPLGEGKSLALRQVAHSVASSRPEWNVLWREPGAPVLTKEWLNDVRAAGKTLICVDEADLIMDDMVSAKDLWAAKGSGIAFLLASHDRLWWKGAGSALRPWIDDVLFHGITDDDARNIALTWQGLGLLDKSQEVDTVVERLVTSAGAMAAENNTLFGAVLDVRYGADLGARVEDLVRKLHEIELTDSVDLGDVYGGICVMQHWLDRDGNSGKGASRSVIAAMAGLDPVFADGKILQTLGREAAVTFAGNRVYCRHPSIAATVVDYLHREGTAEKVYELVGQAGGARLLGKASTLEGYRDAYLFSRSLPVPETVWAAKGAVKGTGPQILESRVSMLRSLRREGEHRSGAYARGLAPRLMEYDDYRGATRAFLVEFSISLRDEGEPQASAGLAALALDDRVGYSLVQDRAGYALVSLAKSAAVLNAQTDNEVTKDAPALCAILLERVRGEQNALKYLSRYRPSAHQELRQLSTGKLCGSLARMFGKTASQAGHATGVAVEIHGALSFDTLSRLADGPRGAASR